MERERNERKERKIQSVGNGRNSGGEKEGKRVIIGERK